MLIEGQLCINFILKIDALDSRPLPLSFLSHLGHFLIRKRRDVNGNGSPVKNKAFKKIIILFSEVQEKKTFNFFNFSKTKKKKSLFLKKRKLVETTSFKIF